MALTRSSSFWRLLGTRFAWIGAVLWLTVALVAPLLASASPIVRVDAGQAWSPLLVSLLDRGVFPYPHERLFNAWLLAALVFVATLPLLAVVRNVLVPHIRRFWTPSIGVCAALGLVLFALSLLPWFAFQWSQPLGYYDPPARGEATSHEPELAAAEALEAQRWRLHPPVPHSHHELASQRAHAPAFTQDDVTRTTHVLGTNMRGTDRAAVLIHGTRHALTVALASALAAMLFGIVLASVGSRHRHGRLGAALDWTAASLHLVPANIVGVLVLSWLPVATEHTLAAYVGTAALLFWGPVYRHVRRASLDRTGDESVDEVRVGRHALRVGRRPALVGGCYAAVAALILEGTLAWLKVLPTPTSWGSLLRDALEAGHAVPALVVCGALATTVVVAWQLGQALRDPVRETSPT